MADLRDPCTRYEIRLRGTTSASLRQRYPSVAVRTTPAETALVRRDGGPEELNELLEELLSVGLVLTAVHQDPDTASAQVTRVVGDVGHPMSSPCEVRVEGELGRTMLSHLPWSHYVVPEHTVMCLDATAAQLEEFLRACVADGAHVESVHPIGS
jgi:hypothetical protein